VRGTAHPIIWGDEPDFEPRGSNGFAIAPSNTADGRALLLINPHTSFFFRSELQVTSDEGLNAYGAATWGQFFIYQGFNERAGWMHTSSGVDVVDEFLETVEQRQGELVYRYGNERRPVETRTVTIAYRQADGRMASRSFETYRTHHGPIVREQSGKWVAFAMMHKPVKALQQSFLRTKVRDHEGFPAGGRKRPAHRLARSARPVGSAEGPQSAERLDPEHEQLALFRRRAAQPETEGLPALHGHVRRESARGSRLDGARSAQGFHARAASGGGL
jgi:hypothetical protein